jgi:hypothetical protein
MQQLLPFTPSDLYSHFRPEHVIRQISVNVRLNTDCCRSSVNSNWPGFAYGSHSRTLRGISSWVVYNFRPVGQGTLDRLRERRLQAAIFTKREKYIDTTADHYVLLLVEI